MTKYLWKKYDIEKSYKEEYVSIRSKKGEDIGSYFTFYENKTIDKLNGRYVLSGSRSRPNKYWLDLGECYSRPSTLGADEVENVSLNKYDVYAGQVNLVYKKYKLIPDFKKGAFIEDIVGLTNEYPQDGVKGGYWYVYQGVANQPPIISGDATQIGVLTNDRSIRFSVNDPDNDAVTVEIKIDGIKTKDSPFVAELGETYNIPIKIADYKIGEHNVEVIATDTGGLSDSRTWYFERGNSNPTISGQDEDLGDKNSGFQIPFSVNDIDLNDELTIQISLNDRVLQTINNTLRNKEYIVDIEDGIVYAQELGKLNTIIIKVTDGQGGVSYRYKYFKRTNTAPIISGEDKDIGVVEKTPVVSFSAKDLENDLMTYSVYLNDKELLKDVKLEANKNIEYKLSKNEFSQLDNIKKHRIRIVVTDAQKATSIRNITFKRKLSKCWHKTIRQTDIQATKFYAFVSTLLSEGAELKVEVCNNANDEEPSWEDATVNVKQGTSYIFKNKEKTHKDWAVGLLVTILPGTSKEPSWILGAGGGFE